MYHPFSRFHIVLERRALDMPGLEWQLHSMVSLFFPFVSSIVKPEGWLGGFSELTYKASKTVLWPSASVSSYCFWFSCISSVYPVFQTNHLKKKNPFCHISFWSPTKFKIWKSKIMFSLTCIPGSLVSISYFSDLLNIVLMKTNHLTVFIKCLLDTTECQALMMLRIYVRIRQALGFPEIIYVIVERVVVNTMQNIKMI